jgi:leader peptidase (prepilin peptidase) / N-methyltransferase
LTATVLALLVGVCAVFGLVIGSFLNVVIYRVPAGESVVHPRSRCPSCGTQLGALDNVPVVSWVVLRGKCRTCASPISPRYPGVELLTGVLFAITAWRLGWDPALPAFLVWVAVLVALSFIDLDTFTLPRKIIYAGAVAGVVLLGAAALVNGELRGPAEAVAGALIGFGVLFVIHVISPRGMGFGDVRLAGLLGLYLGWIELPLVAVGLFLAFLFASVVGISLMLAKRKGRKDRVPFGPFLALGALVAVWVGVPILDLYLGR